MRRRPGRLAPDDLGDAEVGDLHPALLVQQDVLRLDVAVDDALVVGVLQRLADLRTMASASSRRESAGPQQLPQVHAVHVLHQQVVADRRPAPKSCTATMFGWFSRASAWASRANRSAKPRVAARLAGQDLQRHQPVQLRLARLVDRPHAAPAEQFQDFELREVGPSSSQGRRDERRGLGEGGGFPARLSPAGASKPALSRHAGHSPWAAFGPSGWPQCGRCALFP